jgi:hypothetical protein
VSGKVPTPVIVTVMEVGAHPPVSAYRTLKAMVVAVVPLPGVAFPLVR